MRRLIGPFAILCVLAAQLVLIGSVAAGSPARIIRGSGKLIADQYIVVLKDGADARAVAAVAGITPKYVYDAALNGFAATLNAGQLNALQHNPNVDYIEQDQEATTGPSIATTQTNPPWGLDRIDQRTLPLSGTYTYNRDGTGVNAYIINTGIQTSHPEFGGRAVNVYDAFGGNGQDCNGVGTYSAGIVGGKTYGVAKGVSLRGVRVLDCNGSGTISGIIAGVNWVTANHVKPAVAHIAFGGGLNSSLNTAVANMINAGVFTAVAAGNSASDACNYSPASVGVAYTTAASDASDRAHSSSNMGSCVDGYAPGVGVTSTWLNGATLTLSSSTGASAHVTGVAALYKSYGDASSATVTNWINANATTGVLTGVPPGTPNRLLYKASL